jgi:glutamyl-tRNA reductase
MVEGALSKHPSGSLALLDLGLPRNVDPKLNALSNVFLHDLTSLERMVDTNIAKRRGEIPRVEAIIHAEIERLEQKRRSLGAGPLIQGLRQAVEELRQSEVARASKDLSPTERAAVDRATRAVVNKLLHGPTQSIKEAARAGDDSEERLRLIREVFGRLSSGD